MNAQQPTRVFISYAWKDGAQLAQRLYDDLKQTCDPWKDDRRMRAGATWTKEVARALDTAQVVVALVSPGSNASDVCGWERLRALRKSKHVIPVLAVAATDLPLELEGKIYRDLTGAKPYSAELEELLEDIEQRQNGASLPERLRTTYVTTPALPFNYIERADALTTLCEVLIVDEVRPSIAMTALQGMGGIGKTVLAQALCRDEVVQQAFPDGVIWISVGKEPAHDLGTRLREIGKAIDKDHLADYDTELGSTNRYKTVVRDKAALIVLDDVWDARDLEPFRADSPRSRLLFTTRDEEIAAGTGAQLVTPGFLTGEQSREMLARWSGLSADALPPEADDLIRECGGLALAVATIGAMLRAKPHTNWQRVYSLLRSADLGKIGQRFPDYPYPDLLRALQVSVDALDPGMRKRYYTLAVLLEDMPIHPLIQRVLWNADEFDALGTADELVRLALAQRAGYDGSIRLHDLLLDYVRAQYPNREALGLIHEAMRLSSHIIERDSSQFASQLVGRLLPYMGTPAVRDFTQAVIRAAPRPWLRPLKPALQPPGTTLLRTLAGHTGGVNAVALTPDGKRAVSASWDRTLKVWEVESGRALRTFVGHDQWVNAVALTRNGLRAVSASADKTLKVWEIESGCELLTLEGHADEVWAVALTPDGRCAVSASHDKTLKVWDLENGRELRTLQGHAREVYAVAVTPDGRRAVSASSDKTLKVWDLESGRELRTLAGHDGGVRAVAVTPDGCRAVSAAHDYTLKVWELDSGRELRTLQGHRGWVGAVAVTSDGRRAVSGSYDRTLKVWEIETGCELRTLAGHGDRVGAVAVTPDGRHAVSGSFDRTLKVWEIEGDREMQAHKDHAARVNAVALSLDGRRAVSASEDETLKVWDLETGRELMTLEGHTDSVDAVALTPDGRRAVSGSLAGTLKVWEIESGRELQTLKGHVFAVKSVAVTPDGRSAVSAAGDGTLKVWDLETGRELLTLEGHADSVDAVVLTPGGRRAVSASGVRDVILKVWDLETGRELQSLEGHAFAVKSIAVTPDGRRAVSASYDRTLKVWDLETGRELLTLQGHASLINAVAVTPDGLRAVTASADNTLKVWDIEGGRELLTLEGHADRVDAVALTPDGRRAVSASSDKTLKVWDLDSGSTIATFSCEASADCCAVTYDSTIVAGDRGGRIYILALER